MGDRRYIFDDKLIVVAFTEKEAFIVHKLLEKAKMDILKNKTDVNVALNGKHKIEVAMWGN